MATIPKFPLATEEIALQVVRDHDHRITEEPHASQSGEDLRRSWRCLDCSRLVIVYFQIRGYAQARCLGADGSAMTTFCDG